MPPKSRYNLRTATFLNSKSVETYLRSQQMLNKGIRIPLGMSTSQFTKKVVNLMNERTDMSMRTACEIIAKTGSYN